jgi:hypothetical protein
MSLIIKDLSTDQGLSSRPKTFVGKRRIRMPATEPLLNCPNCGLKVSDTGGCHMAVPVKTIKSETE